MSQSICYEVFDLWMRVKWSACLLIPWPGVRGGGPYSLAGLTALMPAPARLVGLLLLLRMPETAFPAALTAGAPAPLRRLAATAAAALASLLGLAELPNKLVRLPVTPAVRERRNRASCASHHCRSSTRLQ